MKHGAWWILDEALIPPNAIRAGVLNPVTEGSEITFYPDACKKLGGVDGDVVFQGNGPSKQMLEKQLARGRKLDDLTGGISYSKLKAMQPGPEKTALEAEVNKLKQAHEAYKLHVAKLSAVSERIISFPPAIPRPIPRWKARKTPEFSFGDNFVTPANVIGK